MSFKVKKSELTPPVDIDGYAHPPTVPGQVHLRAASMAKRLATYVKSAQLSIEVNGQTVDPYEIAQAADKQKMAHLENYVSMSNTTDLIHNAYRIANIMRSR